MALLLLTACADGAMDWDLRSDGLDTTTAAQGAVAGRPEPDANGVISYPDYQVAVAREGDTVTTVATRLGLPPGELAAFNAIEPGSPLREGELLALPTRIAATPAAGIAPAVDVTTIATSALDRVDGAATPVAGTATAPGGIVQAQPSAPLADAPLQHQVKRGETAFSIARTYNVSAKALADWNSLGSDMTVREGQYLIIPQGPGTAALPGTLETAETVAAPGVGSPTPEPPSADDALPEDETVTVAAAATTAAAATPESPELGDDRSTSAAFAMPVNGSIIRPFSKGTNNGIDISAAAGTAVRAAAAGTVAAVTTDTNGTPIVVIRHDGGLLSVYVGVDELTVAKGATVSKGQTIGKVKAGDPAFVHFEIRQGQDALDPMDYLG